jgi:hypothetical protein
MKAFLAAAATAALLAAAPAQAAELGDVNRINDQAFSHSQVLQTAQHLTDRIGGRLTNSPAMRQAEAWTQGKFREWGLANVRTEGFEFGRGWWIEDSRVRMVAPRPITLRAIPVAWTPATSGPLTAEVIVAPMAKDRDFAEWKGKLAGKIVLVTWPAPPKDALKAPFERYTSDTLGKEEPYVQPAYDPDALERSIEQRGFAARLDEFLKAEGAVAWARMSYRDNGLVHGAGYQHRVGDSATLPGVEIAAEDYRRLARLAKVGPVKLEIDSRVHFEDADTKAYNVFADLPGADPKAGYVMAGAHLDSWVAADGAVDNAAGSAVIMEAARILKTMGVKPKRTIRFVLWSGEEQGLLGSANYVERQLASRPPVADPARRNLGPSVTQTTYPVTTLPGYRDMAGYFNIDNGSGKLRGIYVEGNMAANPVLEGWLKPYRSQGVTTVAAAPTGGTDHVYMARIGLPAFQFIQDELDYSSTTHHSSVDTYDHLRAEDLKQAAAVLAWVLLQAADAKDPLPGGVVPTQPSAADPFAYPDPSKK